MHFKEVAPAGASLDRLVATTAAEAAELPGRIRPAEKACFQSHLRAIRDHHDGMSHLMVLEDDVILTGSAFSAPALAGSGWDLLLLDAAIGDVRMWGLMEAERARLDGASRLFDLTSFSFASAAAYVVNATSRERVLAAFGSPTMDAPYDIVMRQLVHGRVLRACLAFPFRTSIAAFSDETSQIRDPNEMDALSNAFRRRIFDGVGDGRSAAELAETAIATQRPSAR